MRSRIVNKRTFVIAVACTLMLALTFGARAAAHSGSGGPPRVPTPPWPAGDELGMGNTQGTGTHDRCAKELRNKQGRVYELSHITSNTMPTSPFGAPVTYSFPPTNFAPGTAHGFNSESVAGETAHQGTQFDALGHFGYLPEAWDGTGEPPAEDMLYYGGFTQAEVKPTPEAPLARLGVDKVPPIITSGILLDARTHLGGGDPLQPGALVTTEDIQAMLQAQGLRRRGILPGDAVLIYTGWEDNWADPDEDGEYYQHGPGLSYDAAQYLTEKAIVLVALDNPFTDPVNEGQLAGEAPPPDGTPPGLPFAIHHHMLAIAGIYQIQNAHLAEMAADQTWLSCTMVLPLRVEGGTGSPVRPVAIGAPRRLGA